MDANMLMIYVIAIVCIGGGLFYFLQRTHQAF